MIMCPCGIINSIKFNVRAESPRDYCDMLLSFNPWSILGPNVYILAVFIFLALNVPVSLRANCMKFCSYSFFILIYLIPKSCLLEVYRIGDMHYTDTC